MNALNIDTHKFVRRLRDAGFEERQAEALVEGLGEADTSQLATRSDIVASASDLRQEMSAIRTELKSDIADLRTEMWKMQFTTIAAVVALVVGILKLFP